MNVNYSIYIVLSFFLGNDVISSIIILVSAEKKCLSTFAKDPNGHVFIVLETFYDYLAVQSQIRLCGCDGLFGYILIVKPLLLVYAEGLSKRIQKDQAGNTSVIV